MRSHHNLRHIIAPQVAIILEPDALVNLVTSHTGTCGRATKDSYRRGIAYAASTLAPLTSIYLDAGHGGWMSYERNLVGFLSEVRELNVWGFLRGFAINGGQCYPFSHRIPPWLSLLPISACTALPVYSGQLPTPWPCCMRPFLLRYGD